MVTFGAVIQSAPPLWIVLLPLKVQPVNVWV